ncbi:MAG: ABC transporter permease [Desulfobacula sp.]|jgi:peptide/nickel transport system permease protein|nr:ABC transporter permease [Desulfobacula sp.]
MAEPTSTPLPVPGVSVFTKNIFRLFRDPLGCFGFFLVIVILSTALFAPWIIPYGPSQIDVLNRLQPPSLDHLLGTDQLGRDVFSRVVMGSRIALKVALITITLAMGIGITLGLIAGYGSKWLDKVIILVFDTFRSFPTIMIALALVTVLGPSLNTVIIVIVITTFPVYGRIARTQTQGMRYNEFILAERAMGAGMFRILWLHVLPNIIGPLLIVASMDIPVVVTIEAGLSFLGVGVPPPTPSWGSILHDGYSFIRNTPWLVISGGVPLILTTLGFTFLGESLRDIFDPKLKKDI